MSLDRNFIDRILDQLTTNVRNDAIAAAAHIAAVYGASPEAVAAILRLTAPPPDRAALREFSASQNDNEQESVA